MVADPPPATPWPGRGVNNAADYCVCHKQGVRHTPLPSDLRIARYAEDFEFGQGKGLAG